MDIKIGNTLENSPQILPFPVENQPPQLSINTDDEEIGLFYREYYPIVYRRCLSILHNEEDAHDAAQDVFAKIQRLKTEGRFHPSNSKNYLFRAAANMSFNQKKRKRRELIQFYDIATGEILKNKDEQGWEEWKSDLIDNGYEQVEAEIIVKTILEEQDEITRRIYFYKYHDDMTLEQIGEAVGLGRSAVHNRIRNLKIQAKAAWGKAEK